MTSIPSSFLFLIYINDIAESFLSLTRLFADDSSLYYSASSIADIEGIINHDLQLLAAWAKPWLIKFNPLKTEAVLFTLTQFEFYSSILKQFEYYSNLFFENVKLKFVECHKHLGVTLNCKDQWHFRIFFDSLGWLFYGRVLGPGIFFLILKFRLSY